ILQHRFKPSTTCPNRCLPRVPATEQPVSGAAHYADAHGVGEGVCARKIKNIFGLTIVGR
ncbi:hypothetical protein, partial [Lysobacter sp. CA199]|uniref:hypothetical protein n=1 Tax=Lysobacter sp. CA199 TaxID=3455608 RepID=UPI003F8D352A